MESGLAERAVDVVIPTVGRRPGELAKALDSVLDQSGGVVRRVLVVVDSGGRLEPHTLPRSSKIEVLHASPSLSARQAGVLAADSPWVAFLDDDDVWVDTKLVKQLELAQGARVRFPVISSRITHDMGDSLASVASVPSSLIGEQSPVADYLFHRRSPRRARPSLFTSTLLAPRALCIAQPWRRIPRHQDWDWLIRATAHGDSAVLQHPDVLVRIRVGSAGSISRSVDWQTSIDWARETLGVYSTPQVRSDFLASQALRYAIAARSSRGVGSVLKALVETRRLPHVGPVAFGMVGVLPSAVLKRALRRGGKRNA